MDTSLPILLGYLVLKAAAYCAWCALGVARFRPASERRLALALGLGTLRLVLGLLFGVGIFFGSALVVAGAHESGMTSTTLAMVLAYLAVYVPVRWIEWGLIEALLHAGARSFSGFLLGASGPARRWRLGGAALSCLADLPVVLATGGLPIGRFLC